MLTRAAEQVAAHTRRMAQLEAELATLEIKQKVSSLGIGIGLLVTGALLAFFGIAFVLTTIAAGFATFLPVWAATLIVAVGLLVIAGGLAAGGVTVLKRSTPPIPELALREAELTTRALRNESNGDGGD